MSPAGMPAGEPLKRAFRALCLKSLFIPLKTLTFAPVKQNVLTYRQNEGQKRANFSASFNAFSLVVSQKMTTLNTHTHTMFAPIVV